MGDSARSTTGGGSRGSGLGGGAGGLGSGGSSASRARGVGGADGAVLDVGEGDGRRSSVGLDISGIAGGDSARATSNTGGGGGSGGRVVGVEPQHVGCVVVPQAHDEDHASLERSGHGGESTLGLEHVVVTEGSLLGRAEGVGDRVDSGDTGNVGVGVLVDLAVLDVDAANFGECAGGGTVGGDELIGQSMSTCHQLKE